MFWIISILTDVTYFNKFEISNKIETFNLVSKPFLNIYILNLRQCPSTILNRHGLEKFRRVVSKRCFKKSKGQNCVFELLLLIGWKTDTILG